MAASNRRTPPPEVRRMTALKGPLAPKVRGTVGIGATCMGALLTNNPGLRVPFPSREGT